MHRFIHSLIGLLQSVIGRLQFFLPKDPWDASAPFSNPESLEKNLNLLDRFREVISDPVNMMIDRVPQAGFVDSEGKVILHNGLKVPQSGPDAYYGKFSQILVLNRGVHEPLEEFVFQELIKKLPDQPVMVEVGAYWAHYSMWLKKVKPQARVIMAEPENTFLDVGRRNFSHNGLAGEFVNAFIGNRGGTHERTLDQLLSGCGLDVIDILHSDIQGAELILLEQAKQTLASGRVKRLMISTHSQALHKEILTLVRSIGFEIEVDSDFDTHTTSQDGLIVARTSATEPIFDRFKPLGRLEIIQTSPKEFLDYLSSTIVFNGRNSGSTE
jgi:hypothetical protein